MSVVIKEKIFFWPINEIILTNTIPEEDSLTIPKEDSLTIPKEDSLTIPEEDSLTIPIAKH
jgi:hypothetical protein